MIEGKADALRLAFRMSAPNISNPPRIPSICNQPASADIAGPLPAIHSIEAGARLSAAFRDGAAGTDKTKGWAEGGARWKA
jgi:hypothetical protein